MSVNAIISFFKKKNSTTAAESSDGAEPSKMVNADDERRKWKQMMEEVESAKHALELEQQNLQTKFAQMLQERDGYKLAYEKTCTDLGAKLFHCEQERDGYKKAYEIVSTELNKIRTLLSESQKVALESLKHFPLEDPPVSLRICSTEGLCAELEKLAEEQKTPEAIRKIILDPEFSIEDRSRYRALLRLSAENWTAAANLISHIVERQYVSYKPSCKNEAYVEQIASELHKRGVVRLQPLLSNVQVQEIQQYFLDRPVFNGHASDASPIRTLQSYVDQSNDQIQIGTYPISDVVAAPHLLEAVLSPLILDAAAKYFSCTPRLSDMQVYWSFKRDADSSFLTEHHYYHRDKSDLRVFFLHIYLSDVSTESGVAYKVLAGSGNLDQVLNIYHRAQSDLQTPNLLKGLQIEDFYGSGKGIPDALKEIMFPEIETFAGPAGTAFISRGIDYHKDCPPGEQNRLILTVKFKLNDFADFEAAHENRIPGRIVARRVGANEQLRYITQPRFDWKHESESTGEFAACTVRGEQC